MKILLIGEVLNGHNGTTKVLLSIARAFIHQENEVKLLFFGESEDSSNIKTIMKDLDYSVLNHTILSNLEVPIKLYFLKSHPDFKLDDLPSFFLQFLLFKKLKILKFNPDYTIYVSLFASFSLIISGINKRSVVFLHESPGFDDFGFLTRSILKMYTKAILRKSSVYAASERAKRGTFDIFGISTKTISTVSFEDKKLSEKEDFVLLDTRWTTERDPFFVIEVAKLLREFPVIMHGYFPDPKVQGLLNSKIEELQLRVRIVSGLAENKLSELYDKAKVVVRWSAYHEVGNSFAITQGISHNCIPIIDENLGSADLIRENVSDDLVVKKDASQFADRIIRIFEDNSYYLQILEKLEIFKKKNTWEVFVRNLIEETGDPVD